MRDLLPSRSASPPTHTWSITEPEHQFKVCTVPLGGDENQGRQLGGLGLVASEHTLPTGSVTHPTVIGTVSAHAHKVAGKEKQAQPGEWQMAAPGQQQQQDDVRTEQPQELPWEFGTCSLNPFGMAGHFPAPGELELLLL